MLLLCSIDLSRPELFKNRLTFTQRWMVMVCSRGYLRPDSNNRLQRSKYERNKTVLLREYKRHTVHHVASTHSAVLSRGYPIPGQGVPYPGLGVPHHWWGFTSRKGPGTSHWGTPQKGHGTSGSIMGWRWGTP